MKNMKEQIEKLRNEAIQKHDEPLKKLDDLLASETPKFEKGKWYKITEHPTFKFIYTDNDGDKTGFNHEGVWRENALGFYKSAAGKYSPCTDYEVESALIKEAEKRGFKEGVKFRKPEGWELGTYLCEVGRKVKYERFNDALDTDGNFLYRKGQWAEIVKDEPVKIGEYEIKYSGNSCFVSVPGENIYYHKSDILKIKEVLSLLKIQSLNAGCSGQLIVRMTDIENILKNWK